MSHLSADFKRSVVEICIREGFREGVRKMLGTMYTNHEQPHNKNVIMAVSAANDEEAGPEKATTHVYRDRQWRRHDTRDAIAEMLEEHGEAIRNFPDELDGDEVPQEKVDAIDRAYDASEHLAGDAGLETTLMGLAGEQLRVFKRDVIDRYRTVLEGIAVAHAEEGSLT